VVQRRELEYAYAPHWFQVPAYIRVDFDQDVSWLFLYGEQDDNYDHFGDGTIRTLFTPGRSPGHTSLVVTLDETAPMMLTADACYTMNHYKNEALPGLIHSAADVQTWCRRSNAPWMLLRQWSSPAMPPTNGRTSRKHRNTTARALNFTGRASIYTIGAHPEPEGAPGNIL
jgi:hypothetical protein